MDISFFMNKPVVTTEQTEHFVPEHTFADFGLDLRLLKTITDRKYEQTTPIQDRVIPHIMRGEDVVGLANTGTGKTAAFLIPLLNKLISNPREQILVVAPTRELAQQIEEELLLFAKGLRLRSVVLVGGTSIKPQISKLKQPNHFIIGTPGRIIDLINQGFLKLDRVRTVVLDEADRMLDMGFINDMRFIMDKVPTNRHTLFFSATMSSNIETLIKDFLTNPVTISVRTQDTSKAVEQDVVRINGRNKIEVLEELLKKPEFKKVLVFGRTKYGIEKLSRILRKGGIRAESIHGNKTQSQRQRSLLAFKQGKAQALCATDVAARGLDIDDVTHVINYDLPSSNEDYVHRIGRTGRGGKRGKALTFID